MRFSSLAFSLVLLWFALGAAVAQPALAQEEQEDLPAPEETEVWEPEPPAVAPGATHRAPPSDAVVLFGGEDLSAWQQPGGRAPAWTVAEGVMTVAPGGGGIETKQAFGDVQLHIEWRTPADTTGRSGQDRGNSGVFFQGRYEVQVLDSYKNRTYSNGQAGSIYKQHIPAVNASTPPGTWQSYDIVFIAPRFGEDSTLASPARLTVFHNGVLLHHDAALEGGTVYRGQPSYEAHAPKLPLALQDHSQPVSFRNIWVRELDAGSSQTDGGGQAPSPSP